MNILLIIILVLLVIFTLNGYKKGLIRAVFSLFAAVIAITFTSMSYMGISKVIQDNTKLDETIQAQIAEVLEFDTKKEVKKKTKQTEIIDNLPVPEVIKKSIIENNTPDIYSVFEAIGFYDYIGKSLTCIIMNAIAFVLTYMIIFIILNIAVMVLDMMSKLPIINQFNKVGGIIFGALQGVIAIWIFFSIITMLGATSFGQQMYKMINESQLLSWIYNNNFILEALANIPKFLF